MVERREEASGGILGSIGGALGTELLGWFRRSRGFSRDCISFSWIRRVDERGACAGAVIVDVEAMGAVADWAVKEAPHNDP